MLPSLGSQSSAGGALHPFGKPRVFWEEQFGMVFVEAMAAGIAIVATPAESAQQVVDRLVRSGVKAILNFAPVPLNVPPDVEVKTVNMALELETLSYSLANR